MFEKDWYVVRALAALNEAETKPFRLVFSGGTALSRAHRLIRRMSEDIDLKILADDNPSRPAYRRLRDTISNALLNAGFRFDPEDSAQCESGNASRYMLYRLPYDPIAAGHGSLRPEIQIEAAVWPLRLPAVDCSLISFVAEALKQPAEVPAISCASLPEVIAEKFVALTRRAGAELANAGGPRDPTLVRHIYDLHVTRNHYNAAEVITLAREIMMADVKAYGHQFPAYRDDPVAETLRAISGLAAGEFAERYSLFLRDMVYGEERPEFKTAFATMRALANRLAGA